MPDGGMTRTRGRAPSEEPPRGEDERAGVLERGGAGPARGLRETRAVVADHRAKGDDLSVRETRRIVPDGRRRPAGPAWAVQSRLVRTPCAVSLGQALHRAVVDDQRTVIL